MKTLYLNGPIYTMESPRPVSALLVKDGTIAALGPDALFAVGAKTVDLQGRALLPAFLDAHSHLAASANALLQVPLGDAACFEDIAQAISGFIRRQRVKPGQWVMAQGYDHNQLAEQAHPLLGLDSDTFYIYHVAAVMVDNLRRLLLGINLSDKAIMDFDFPGVGFPV